MRRRRRRWPFIVLAAIALLAGASLGLLTSGVRPSGDLLAWLGSQAGGTPAPSSSAGEPGVSPTGSGSGAVGTTEPGPSEDAASPGAGASETATASVKPIGSATPSPDASGSPSASGRPASPAPSATPASATGGQARAVSNGSRARKVVALTFDDGYNPVALRQILAILKREHVTATFFPYGWAVHQDIEGWHMVAAAGYPIGNHTLTHAILTTLTPAQVTEELTRGHRTIDLYSGAKSVNLMRPPGGAFTAVTAKAIKKAGYDTIVLWDVDTFDWQGPSAATILARATKGTNGSIVLMHSGPLNTPKALPGIIANYRARGFSFVTVPELLAAR